MYTGIEKNSSFAAFHAAVNTGTPQDVDEARAVVSTMLRLQAHYIRLQSRAMEHAARVLGVEVDPEHWAALACEDLNEALLNIDRALNEADEPYDNDDLYGYIGLDYSPAAEHRLSLAEVA